MNREIKFRVWTGATMEYKVMAGFLGAFFVQGMDEHDSACMSEFNTRYPEACPVMQFTGIIRGGKEVYEGDILPAVVGHKCIGGPRKVMGVVTFYTCESGSGYHLEYDANPGCGICYIEKGYRVIGNIYENQNLLKVQK